MSDPNNQTISPQNRPSGVRPGLTQHMQAVAAKKAARVAESPGKAMVEAIVQKALGIGILWKVQPELTAAVKSGDKVAIAVWVGFALLAIYFLAPGLTMAFLKFARSLIPFGKKDNGNGSGGES